MLDYYSEEESDDPKISSVLFITNIDFTTDALSILICLMNRSSDITPSKFTDTTAHIYHIIKFCSRKELLAAVFHHTDHLDLLLSLGCVSWIGQSPSMPSPVSIVVKHCFSWFNKCMMSMKMFHDTVL